MKVVKILKNQLFALITSLYKMIYKYINFYKIN